MMWLELLHVLCTVFMVAVIWFVQVVHYPLFAHVGRGEFAAFEAAHVRRISWIVMPAMLTELGAALGLVALGSTTLSPAECWAGLGCLGAIWTSTFFVQVPLHRRLSQGFAPAAVGRLVRSNWIRTVAWSARGALVTRALIRVLD